MDNGVPKVNTLLQYRFIKKPRDKLRHCDSSGSETNLDDSEHTQDNGNAHGSTPAETAVSASLLQNHESEQEATPEDCEVDSNSQTTIPETPQVEPVESESPSSPVFGPKIKVIRQVYSEDSEELESQTPSSASSHWLSKEKGKRTFANGSKLKFKGKLKKFRRIQRMNSNMSDSDSEPEEPKEKVDDGPSFDEKLSSLKQMFPTRDAEELKEILKKCPQNFESIVDMLMSGSSVEELSKKRKFESSQSSLETLPELEQPYKRIRRPLPSDSEDTQGTENNTDDTVFDPQMKERLCFLYEAFPDHSNDALLKALQDCNWSTEDAAIQLTKEQEEEKNKVKKKTKKGIRRDEDLSDEDDDYESGDGGFDSDDSLAGEQGESEIKMMLSFFEEATTEELMSVPGCSRKKAELIISERPFENWDTLVSKFDSSKSLTYNLISGCRETIHIRSVVVNLMQRCEKISEEMEKVVSGIMSKTIVKEGDDQITTQPKILNENFDLKPYQMVGLNWLRIMHAQELNGILADEMGLGKTVQTIAFLAHLLEEKDTGPHAVIVPSSTIDNWLREMRKWCPTIKVTVYYGSQDERRVVRQRILYSGRRDFNVLLTTYNIATGSVEDRALFKKCEFHYAVFDEGHLLKNMASLRFQNLMKIRAERRLLLTGTPLQNNLVELMSLLCFVMPDIFSGKTEPLKKIFTMISRASDDVNRGRYEKQRIAQAKRIMRPFVLRRLKSEVLQQLPEKHERIEYCTLIPDQQDLYDSLISQYSKQLEDADENINSTGGMSMFMQLRKVANHPLLVRNLYTDEKLAEISKCIAKEPSHRERGALPHLIQEDMSVMNDFDLHKLCLLYKKYVGKYALDISVINESGKFRMLDNLLEDMKIKGDRVLLFSQFTMMLDIIEPYLKDKDIRYLRLDGTTPVPERQKLIDDYNNDPDIFVFLLSTRAGGLGINLTAANVVILHDIDFNPYNDKQAEDRCHRLGQMRDVNIIRLVSKDTVEESMLRCAQEKLKLEKDVTTSGNGGDDSNSSDVLSLLKDAFSQINKMKKSTIMTKSS